MRSRIATSWRRCLIGHKLDPARQGPPQTLTEAEIRHVAEPMEETIRLLTPELDDLARVLRDAGYCVNLADANATMLFSRLPGEADARMFMDWKIYTGSNFAEAFEGTNGLGTASPSRSRSWCIATSIFARSGTCSPARWRRCSTMPGASPVRSTSPPAARISNAPRISSRSR